jgi:hypothetical protein
MSIPLDRLYYYIERIVQEVYGDTIIYRFYPHGSKKIEDLKLHHSLDRYSWKQRHLMPVVYCNDQEPLNFEMYQNIDPNKTIFYDDSVLKTHTLANIPDYNLTIRAFNIHDKSILLHSEKRSIQQKLYSNSYFVPVYYWSHAVISLDWFRYAQYESIRKTTTPTRFLIYNRAWSNTREYRLKFLDLLIDHQLIDQCCTSFNPYEPEDNIPYQEHNFKNKQWKPTNKLENYFTKNNATSHCSADFNTADYNSTDIEVVLETLFDDSRLHLTEKSLRPIACKQPFILAATHGSLEYLRSYGFKTFDNIIDESYDLIQNPAQRLSAIISTMKKISEWTEDEYKDNMVHLQQIAEYNHRHFFSKDFFNMIIDELKYNLSNGFEILKNTNTGTRYIELRKILAKNEMIRKSIITSNQDRSQQDIIDLLKIARHCQSKNP